MSTEHVDFEPRTLKLDRGFRWISPFFASLIPFTVWAFFLERNEPADVQSGVLAIGVLAFFAVYCHLAVRRTFVNVTNQGIEVGSLAGVRAARWSEIRYVVFEGSDLMFYLTVGKPLKASAYLGDFNWLERIARERGLFREVVAA